MVSRESVWDNLTPKQKCAEVNKVRIKQGQVPWPNYLSEKQAIEFDKSTAAAATADMPWDKFTIKPIHIDAITPHRGTPESAGWDLFACTDVTLEPGNDYIKVPLGILVKFPTGYYGEIKCRSGHARDRKMEVFNGTIDRDFEGDLTVLCRTRASTSQRIPYGTAIAQIVLIPTTFLQQVADIDMDLYSVADDRKKARGAGAFFRSSATE